MHTLAYMMGFGWGPYGGWAPWLLLVLFPALLGIWAAWRVKSVFGWASKIAASCGMSGAEVATEIMRAHNITDVSVEESHGFLSDHYDPKAKVLRLSPDVFNGRSVASIGVAAHEAGHALQHAENYGPLTLRSAVVPMAQAGGVAANIALMIGMFAFALIGPKLGVPMLIIGVLGLSAIAVFQLITLPVEFDASNRAKKILTTTGILSAGEETAAMHRVLNAAAMTYVAALVSTLGTILYYLLIIFSGSRRN
ncbi:MAG TPA: zinc metallopeptidase [Phycisphaerales bacterium]|nr:zinc metallopeptidase [Phycisphaerales bacterium]